MGGGSILCLAERRLLRVVVGTGPCCHYLRWTSSFCRRHHCGCSSRYHHLAAAVAVAFGTIAAVADVVALAIALGRVMETRGAPWDPWGHPGVAKWAMQFWETF